VLFQVWECYLFGSYYLSEHNNMSKLLCFKLYILRFDVFLTIYNYSVFILFYFFIFNSSLFFIGILSIKYVINPDINQMGYFNINLKFAV
jgi:hypothetical protein